MQYLNIWDLLLTPIYIAIIIAIAKRQRNKKYPIGHPLRKYYLPGLYMKLGGAIFIALIYQFYYGAGDTFNYYYHSQIINSSLSDSLNTWLDLILHKPVNSNPNIYLYTSQMFWYNDPSSYTVARIAAVIGLFCGTTYIPIALFFAFLAYTGMWAMYRTFVFMYPNLTKELAIAFLFIPSTVVWGSAIFKDTVCMFGLGWMTYSTFRIFINKDFSIKNIIMLVISFYLIALIKLYILLAFIPALNIWLLMTYSNKIKIAGLRWIINLLFIGITLAAFSFFTEQFAQDLNKYSLEKIAKTAEVTRSWIGYVSDLEGGSSYDLGEFEPTPGGMLSKFPQAVAVTLYRPFLWETKKVIVAFSALESMFFLFLSLKLFFRYKLKLFKLLGRDPNLVFFVVFALIFAFAVGISSYNFGALSRYKIPCLPFFTAALLILLNKDKHKSAGVTQDRNQRSFSIQKRHLSP